MNYKRKWKMFKVINGGQLPTRGSKYSAAVDLYAREDVLIGAGDTKLIPLGICIDLSHFENLSEYQKENMAFAVDENGEEPIDAFKKSHYLQLMLRSSLSKELIIANGVGVIDLDYKDEIMIRVHKPLRTCSYGVNESGNNHFEVDYKDDLLIKKGDRVAQITLLEHKGYLFGIDTEDERTGGFGSSGVN